MNVDKKAAKYPKLLQKAKIYCESIKATDILYLTILGENEFRVIYKRNGKGEAKILNFEEGDLK